MTMGGVVFVTAWSRILSSLTANNHPENGHEFACFFVTIYLWEGVGIWIVKLGLFALAMLLVFN